MMTTYARSHVSPTYMNIGHGDWSQFDLHSVHRVTAWNSHYSLLSTLLLLLLCQLFSCEL